MPTIGLTGNFGMGKTTVLRIFRKLGAYTFNSDDYVHDILKRPEVIRKISTLLGNQVILKRSNGILLNKNRVADIVFNESMKRKAIEKIIHPEVFKAIKSARANILKKDSSALIIFEVPLLFEAALEKFFDKTVVIYCNREKALDRALGKGFTEDEAEKRIRAQMPITEKKKRADFRIENNGDLNELKKRVERVFNSLISI